MVPGHRDCSSACAGSGKEVYFINYNNDVHNPASRANQKDIAMRMQQFFDNKLKGKPAPDWMVKGIPGEGQRAGSGHHATADHSALTSDQHR